MTTPALGFSCSKHHLHTVEISSTRAEQWRRIHHQHLSVVLNVLVTNEFLHLLVLSVAHRFLIVFIYVLALFESLAILPLKPHILDLSC